MRQHLPGDLMVVATSQRSAARRDMRPSSQDDIAYMAVAVQAARLERAIAASQRVQLDSLRRQLEARSS